MHDETFQLLDAKGQPHEYELTYHPGGEGFALSVQLAKLGLPTLLGLLDKDADLDAKALLGALESINLVALKDQLLRHVVRDGSPLAQPIVFDEAYRGNHIEAWLALWEVVRRNRFLPELDTFSNLGKAGAAG